MYPHAVSPVTQQHPSPSLDESLRIGLIDDRPDRYRNVACITQTAASRHRAPAGVLDTYRPRDDQNAGHRE